MGRIADIQPFPLSPDHDPWEQQPKESTKAYDRFTKYRDMTPTRSYRRLAVDQGVTHAAINEQAKRYSWTARAAAWDRHLAKEADAELIAQRREAAKRHAQLASSHLAALSLTTRELGERVSKNPELLGSMPLDQLMRMEAAMARATPRLVVSERLALGMSTENVDVRDDRDREVAAMTDEELDATLTAGGVGGQEFLDGLEAGARVAVELAAQAAERAGSS